MIRQSAEVSNQLTAVERVLEYRDLEPEKEPKKPLEVPVEWPQNGGIEFRNVIYRYFAEAEPVLRNLSFVIKPKEKIGNYKIHWRLHLCVLFIRTNGVFFSDNITVRFTKFI